jgi:hypothetical protein
LTNGDLCAVRRRFRPIFSPTRTTGADRLNTLGTVRISFPALDTFVDGASRLPRHHLDAAFVRFCPTGEERISGRLRSAAICQGRPWRFGPAS